MKPRDAEFFRPVWRRVAVTAVCVLWAVLELFGHDSVWIAVTVGLTGYAVWIFFIRFPKAARDAAITGDDNAPPAA